MLKKKLETFLKEYRSLIRESKSKEIQKELEILNNRWDESEVDALINSVCAELINELEFIDNEKEFELAIAKSMEEFNATADMIGDNYVFRVSLDQLDNEIYRLISVPSFLPLSALAYSILASMHADGEHLFDFRIHHERYVCDLDESGDVKASYVHFMDLDLSEGMKFTLTYDFGENYVFNIEYMGNRSSNKIIEVLEGKGYGILEDNKKKLYQAYANVSKGKTLPKKYEKFDLEENEMEILSHLHLFADMYGEDDEDEFDYDMDWLEDEPVNRFKGNQA